jgi:hypothetical protein
VAVEWLPLTAAIQRLSYPLEKLFLNNVGPVLNWGIPKSVVE